jgi:hypothetical protein
MAYISMKYNQGVFFSKRIKRELHLTESLGFYE